MDHCEHAEPLAPAHALDQGGVVDHQQAGIRHEELPARRALLVREPLEVVEGSVGQGVGRNDRVQADVDGDHFLGPRFAAHERVVQRRIGFLLDEVDDRRGTTARGGDSAGGEIVGRAGDAQRRVLEMRVRVDTAGDDEAAGGVDRHVWDCVEAFAVGDHGGDPLLANVDIGVDDVRRRHECAAADAVSCDEEPLGRSLRWVMSAHVLVGDGQHPVEDLDAGTQLVLSDHERRRDAHGVGERRQVEALLHRLRVDAVHRSCPRRPWR